MRLRSPLRSRPRQTANECFASGTGLCQGLGGISVVSDALGCDRCAGRGYGGGIYLGFLGAPLETIGRIGTAAGAVGAIGVSYFLFRLSIQYLILRKLRVGDGTAEAAASATTPLDSV